jgi:sulfhydrogenase subunit alpha
MCASGGFYRVPSRREMQALRDEVAWSLEATLEALSFAGTLTYPDFEQTYECVALHRPDEYAILDGRLHSSKGLDIAIEEFSEHFYEEHVPHSTALHGALHPRGSYLVGPIARFNMSFEQLSPAARSGAEARPEVPCLNPFKSILVRLVETAHACEWRSASSTNTASRSRLRRRGRPRRNGLWVHGGTPRHLLASLHDR